MVLRLPIRFLQVTAVALWSLGAPFGSAAAEDASATLPLQQVLDLIEAKESANPAREPVVDAALQSLSYEGRLLDDAAELTVHCEVAVLEPKSWVKVAILALGEGVHLGPLPDLPRGAFLRDDETLYFTVRGAGPYSFSLALVMEAQREGALRRLRVPRGNAPAVALRLHYDEDLYALHNRVAARDAKGTTLLPDAAGFALEWKQRRSAPAAVPAARPAIEARVDSLHASSVSTLEGERVTRLLYRLRFAGEEEIRFELPPGERLLRAYRNGIAVPAVVEESVLRLALTPAQRGGEGGTVELVLAGTSRDGFHLDGRLHFGFPRASWPTRQLFLDTHLPAVFQYRWRGGSLSQCEGTPDVSYSYPLPTPGTRLRFRQVLVSSHAPDLELDYAVDLEGQYFRAGR